MDTGEDKDRILTEYQDSGYLWIEDKVQNAECGLKYGLDSVLFEHGFNMDNEQFKNIPLGSHLRRFKVCINSSFRRYYGEDTLNIVQKKVAVELEIDPTLKAPKVNRYQWLIDLSEM